MSVWDIVFLVSVWYYLLGFVVAYSMGWFKALQAGEIKSRQYYGLVLLWPLLIFWWVRNKIGGTRKPEEQGDEGSEA